MEKSQLEKVLQISIKECKSSAGSQPGDNVAGSLQSYDILTANDERLYLIEKFISRDDPFQRDFAVENQSFRVENAFYSTLVPALEKFGSSKIGTEFRLPVPKYYAGFNNDHDDYIILEDLRPGAGFAMSDKYAGLTIEEAKLVLTKLGEFHALSYAFIRWEGEKIFDAQDFKIFKRNLLDMPKIKQQGEMMFNRAYQLSMELIGKRDEKLAERMKKLGYANTIEELFGTSLKTDKVCFPVIILGDLWTNNIMMKYDINGHPIDLKFIDFQLARRGNIFEELKYFMFTSTTPKFRKEHLTQVLVEYYNSFVNMLAKLQCPVPINFTRGFLLDQFRECYPLIYKYLTFAIPLQLGDGSVFKPPKPEPEQQQSNGHEGPPVANGTPNDVSMDPDKMMEMELTFFIMGLRGAMEASPRAVDRLLDITKEMAELNVI